MNPIPTMAEFRFKRQGDESQIMNQEMWLLPHGS
jgi:hypothetical protein